MYETYLEQLRLYRTYLEKWRKYMNETYGHYVDDRSGIIVECKM